MAKTRLFDPNPSGLIEHDHNNDGIDRRGFLKCMAWAGTGALCVIQGGVLKSFALGSGMGSERESHKKGELTFVQIMGADPLADARILLSRQLLLSRSSALFVPTKPYGRTHARNHRASSAARRAPLDAARSSVRTLQRQLALHGLLFVLIRQAVRITIAGHRIRTSTESFAMTAQAAFYFDSAHMIHAWQTACGVTPSAYRSIATLSARGR